MTGTSGEIQNQQKIHKKKHSWDWRNVSPDKQCCAGVTLQTGLPQE